MNSEQKKCERAPTNCGASQKETCQLKAKLTPNRQLKNMRSESHGDIKSRRYIFEYAVHRVTHVGQARRVVRDAVQRARDGAAPASSEFQPKNCVYSGSEAHSNAFLSGVGNVVVGQRARASDRQLVLRKMSGPSQAPGLGMWLDLVGVASRLCASSSASSSGRMHLLSIALLPPS